jgi:HlyD family secretion protein
MNARAILILSILVLTACSPGQSGTYAGYAEGEYLYLSPREPGTLETLAVAEGAEVKAGDALFALDAERRRQAVARAQAARDAALARVADLSAGARPEELKQLAAAKSWAEKTAQRSRELYAHGQISKVQLDRDETDLTQARAALANGQGGRANAIAAATSDAEGAAAALTTAALDLADRTVKAPAAGRIERIFHRPGEMVGAGTPVLSLLPPDLLKVRFFVPERALSRFALGQAVRVTCDACARPLAARISFIAEEPQFTPPVIYSLGERQKLVFLVEAKPEGARALRPGQPVDVSLSP